MWWFETSDAANHNETPVLRLYLTEIYVCASVGGEEESEM